MNEKLLEMKHVTKKFPGVIALNDVSIDVRKGEILGIVGENGAGKSTLMKVLSGSYSNREYEGEIRINGKIQSFSSVADSKKAGIEMVYQEVNAMYEASVAENIFVGNYPGKGFVNYKKLYQDTRDLLDQLGMEVSPKTLAGSLNSGQLQLMSIVRAISAKPKIMVLDEPSTALTDTEVDILMKFMDKLRNEGVSLIYISHKLEEIFRICDRVTIIRDGNVITTGSIDEFDQESLVQGMIGRKVENLYVKGKHEAGDVVLEVNNLSVPHPTIDHRNIVDHISFQLHKGEILGFGGLVGGRPERDAGSRVRPDSKRSDQGSKNRRKAGDDQIPQGCHQCRNRFCDGGEKADRLCGDHVHQRQFEPDHPQGPAGETVYRPEGGERENRRHL